MSRASRCSGTSKPSQVPGRFWADLHRDLQGLVHRAGAWAGHLSAPGVKFENGVLTVTLPKSPAAVAEQKIAINAE